MRHDAVVPFWVALQLPCDDVCLNVGRQVRQAHLQRQVILALKHAKENVHLCFIVNIKQALRENLGRQ